MGKKEKTVQEVFETLTEEQKNVVYALIGQALEENGGQQNEEDDKMKQNANLLAELNLCKTKRK